MRSSNHNSLV